MRILLCMCLLLFGEVACAGNFVAGRGATPEMVAAAEMARVKSSQFWTGEILPDWREPCVIEWTPDEGSGGGATHTRFGQTIHPFLMSLNGPLEKTLTHVIPHEVDHTVRQTLIGKPVNRLIDEGCASLFEPTSVDREAFLSMLLRCPDPRGCWSWIDANEYPSSSEEVGWMYGAGISIADYLMKTHGKGKVLRIQHYSPRMSQGWDDVFGESIEETASKWLVWYRSGSGSTVTAKPEPRDVVIFTFDSGCPPCNRLAADVNAGAYAKYKLKIYKCNSPGDPTWKTAEGRELYQEFRNGVGGNVTGLPVIWVYGTDRFKQGYGANDRAGVIGFIADALELIGSDIIGLPKILPPPNQAPPFQSNRGAAPAVYDLRESPDSLRKEIADIRSDIAAIKDGSLFEKLAAVKELRDDVGGLRSKVVDVESRQMTLKDAFSNLGGIWGDVERLKEGGLVDKSKAVIDLKARVEQVAADAASIKEQAKDDPATLIWGTLGVFVGLGKRWYQSRREVAV